MPQPNEGLLAVDLLRHVFGRLLVPQRLLGMSCQKPCTLSQSGWYRQE